MFEQVVEALKTAEDEIKKAMDELWVPFDPATGTGGLHWHGAASLILPDAFTKVQALRLDLESKEPPVPTPAAEVAAEEAPAPAPEEAPAEVPAETPETPEEAPTEAPSEPVNPSPVTEPDPALSTTAVNVNG